MTKFRWVGLGSLLFCLAALFPSQAQAFWTAYGWRPPYVVPPPVVVAPPIYAPPIYAPRVYAPPYYAPPYYGPPRYAARWIPPHYDRWGRWHPGHWG